jgi:repressor LexA
MVVSVFSTRLKELRCEFKLSQQELADTIGTSKSSINMYERGEREPGLDTVKSFADFFDVKTDYLLGKSDDKRSVKEGVKYNKLILNIAESYRKKHGLTTQQMEGYLDWENMYEELESGRVLTSEAFLDVIKSLLNVLDMPLPDVRPVAQKRFPVLGNVACGEPIWAEEERGTFVDGVADIDADFCLIAKGDSMINARIFDGDVLFVKKQPMVEDGEIAVVLVDNEATVKRVYYDRENNVITLVPENPTHKPMRFEGAKLDEITILGKVVAGQFVVR